MAKHAHSRDMHVRVSYGELAVQFTAEGVSYSPDALDDMKRRAVQAFTEAWELIEPFERFTVSVLDALQDDELAIEELVEEDHED